MLFYCHDFVGVHSVHSENIYQKGLEHVYMKKKRNFKIKKRISVALSSIEVYMTVIFQFWSKVFKICQIPVASSVVSLGCILKSYFLWRESGKAG